MAQIEGIKLLWISIPKDYASDHMLYNALWSVAREHGIDGIKYDHPGLRFGLRYSSDFANWQYLNVKGSVTFSGKLASDLKELFDMSDRCGDAFYASYDACSADWYT